MIDMANVENGVMSAPSTPEHEPTAVAGGVIGKGVRNNELERAT